MKSVKTCGKLLEVLDNTLQEHKDIPAIFVVCRDNYYDSTIHDEHKHLCLNSYFVSNEGLSDNDVYVELDFEDVIDGYETSVSELKDKINYEIKYKDQKLEDPVTFWEVYKFAYAKIYDFKSSFMDKALVIIIVEDNIARFKNHINIVSHKLMQKFDAYLEMRSLEVHGGDFKIEKDNQLLCMENLRLKLENNDLEEKIRKMKEENKRIEEEIRIVKEKSEVRQTTKNLSLFEKFCWKITDLYLSLEKKYLNNKTEKF